MPRYEAREGVVYDRENDVVVNDYRCVVLTSAGIQQAKNQARAMNTAERETDDLRRMMEDNRGVL